MSILSLNPAVAAARIGEDGTATYVDVRTVAEFAGGHPRGRVINVPVVFHHPTTGEDHPNPSFELVIAHALAPDADIVVGADDGPRAAQAAERIAAAGYEHVSVMPEGLPGWKSLGLPVTGDNRDGVSYVSLLTPAKRAAEKQAKKKA